MTCKTCGAKGLLISDVVGLQCVYCFGTETKKKSYWECAKCGKESKGLTNDLCKECFEIVFNY